jgi:hypothetical protein
MKTIIADALTIFGAFLGCVLLACLLGGGQ